ACIVEEDNEERQGNEREGKHARAHAPAHQKPKHRGDPSKREYGLDQLSEPDLAARLEPHGKRRLVPDRNPKDSPANVLRGEHATLHFVVRNEREALSSALPQHLAAP